MRRALPLALLILAAGCLAPAEEDPPADTTPRATPTPTPGAPTPPAGDVRDAEALVVANTRFALDLVRELSAGAPRENLVVSPFSVATALQMLFGGAEGATRAAMADALRLEGVEGTLDAQAQALLANLTSSDPNVTLRIGNSLWLDETFAPAVEPGFPARIAASYDGDLYAEDFRDAATVDKLNAWASEKTEGKVPRVIDSISQDEVLFLVNAVYFKGSWAREFNGSCTHDAPFATDAGATVTVAMMCGAPERAHAFSQDEARTIARLPYGDGRFATYLVLPPEDVPLDAFVATWDGSFDAAYTSDVRVEMPRLALRTSGLDLRPALTAQGMGVAFTSGADLSGIAEDLYVSRVVHDAVLEVDEKGTVAAAVTTVGVGVTSLPPEPFHLVFDRPFLLAIRDDASGTLLFVAKVHDPTAT